VEPLLFKYRVNVAFYGHNHVVQRHSATFNKTVVQKSVATTDSKVSPLTRNDKIERPSIRKRYYSLLNS
jgi:hypothetical protein